MPVQRRRDSAIPRVVSFIVLLAILLLMAAVLFQVMRHFVVPLFLASVLVVVFKPLHELIVERLPGHPQVSALGTTLLILLVVLLPTVWLGWKATVELRAVYRAITRDAPVQAPAQPGAGAASSQNAQSAAVSGQDTADDNLAAAADGAVDERLLATLVDRTPQRFKQVYSTVTGETFSAATLKSLFQKTVGFIGAVAVSSFQVVVKLLFGLVIMVLALYYFLSDGPKMLATLMQLSPLDDEYERELLDKFANVSRAVVVASLASAVAQGMLAGIGYYFALNEGSPIFLLTMLTMVLAIVPFAGAASVWAPTSIWIYLYQTVYADGQPVLDAAGAAVQGDSFSAICLALYGLCIVSAIDNVIKPLVLHGQSNLHPLVALISILGGVQALGPIGILVGPMLVAFIQALLNMVNKELLRFGGEAIESKPAGVGQLVVDAKSTAEAERPPADPDASAGGVGGDTNSAGAANSHSACTQTDGPADTAGGSKRRRRRK